MRFLLRASTKVSFGVPFSQNGESFDENNLSQNGRILMRLCFSRQVLKIPVYLGVHEFSSSAEKAKYRELSLFCLIVLVLQKIQHLPAPADKQRVAVKQRLVRGEVDDDVVVALDRKNVDVVFFADIQRHKGASRPT